MAKSADDPSLADGQVGSDLSDEQLLIRYQQKREAAIFDELVQRYEREIYNYLLRYLRNAELAEDAFQATFFRVHEKCQLFTEGHRVRPWLYSIATHQAVDLLRREGRHQAVSLDREYVSEESDAGSLLNLLESTAPNPLAQLEAEEWGRWTRRAVDELPEPLRVVVLLVYFQGLKYREAAEALDIPLGTVKSRLHKALIELNTAWKREHPLTRE